MPDALFLLPAGLAAGVIAGTVGVGGGIIFAPVLFYFYSRAGVDPSAIPALTIGTSLLCTVVTSLSSAWFHDRKGAVERPVAAAVGVSSAVAVVLITKFVTTQPWYDREAFAVVFAVLLVLVALRMAFGGSAEDQAKRESGSPLLTYLATGTVAGSVSASAGVGGGVVLVPAYNRFLGLPIRRAVGTSSATIIVIASVGVLSNVVLGWGTELRPGAVGYVDVIAAAMLSIPAVFTARLGVGIAHYVSRVVLRRAFAAVAVLVALRLVVDALGGA